MNRIIKQAFTLIELLVVIAIIGILSGLIIITMSGATDKARIAKGQVFSNSIRSALMGNMVAEWKLDEGSGTTTNDTWGGLNTGTLTNFDNTGAGSGDIITNTDGWMTSANCISGGCLRFDGVNDYVSFGSSLDLKNNVGEDMTISAWIKTSSYGIIYAPEDYCYFHVESVAGADQGKLQVRTYNSHYSLYSTITVNDNKWHQVALVLSRADAKLYIYIDGALNVQDSYQSTWTFGTATAETVKIGRRGVSAYLPFTGSMDEIRVYTVAIPTSQIKEQYYAGLNNLLASGKMNKEEYNKIINSITKHE
jgi:prepilin-type N-terminal cleavage/methylation domain-containing protein